MIAGPEGVDSSATLGCCQTLKNELGIDPDPATAELARRMSAREPRSLPAATFKAIGIERPRRNPTEEMLKAARAELAASLEIGATQIEGLRRDRAVMSKILARMERIIYLRQGKPSPALESMCDDLKRRLNSSDHCDLVPRPRSNGAVADAELRI
jgi:hypothetical protein